MDFGDDGGEMEYPGRMEYRSSSVVMNLDTDSEHEPEDIAEIIDQDMGESQGKEQNLDQDKIDTNVGIHADQTDKEGESEGGWTGNSLSEGEMGHSDAISTHEYDGGDEEGAVGLVPLGQKSLTDNLETDLESNANEIVKRKGRKRPSTTIRLTSNTPVKKSKSGRPLRKKLSTPKHEKGTAGRGSIGERTRGRGRREGDWECHECKQIISMFKA